MANVVRVPNGDGTRLDLDPLGGGTHFSEIDEGVPGDDGTSTVSTSTNTADLEDYLLMEDMPGDFDVAIDAVVNMRTQITGRVDDTINLFGRVRESDESTPVGETTIKGANHTWETSTRARWANTDNAATWNSYKLNCAVQRSNTGMPDSITSEFTAIEVDIQYSTAIETEFSGTLAEQPQLMPKRVRVVGYGMAVGKE